MRLARPLAGLVFAAAVSCGSFSGSNGGGGAAPSDGGVADDGASFDGGGALCESGSCASSQCPTLYVSGDGNDTNNDGCSVAHPKRTIGAAVSAAQAVGAQAIHICHGMYAEQVRLDQPVSLSGGYDCATGARPADYGYPTFDPNTQTTIVSPASTETQGASATLTVALPAPSVDGGAAPSAISIDGLRIVGAPSGPAMGSAVSIEGPAPITLTNDSIEGGGTSSTAPAPSVGSVGVTTLAGAAPEISHCSLSGGSGTSSGAGNVFGSAAVYMQGSSGGAYIHDSKVSGGSGTSSGVGSLGIIRMSAKGASKLRIESSTIDAGTGHTSSATTAAVAVDVGGPADLDIIGNVITGGAVTCDTSCNAAAVLLATADAHVQIRNNRIYGGDATLSLAPIGAQANFYGLYIAGAASLAISQNLIHPGNQITPIKQVNTEIGLQFATSAATPTKNVTIYQNTFRVVAYGNEPAAGISVLPIDIKMPTPTALDVQGNLFVGGSGLGTYAFTSTVCGTFSNVSNNGFVGIASVLYALGSLSPGTCGAAATYDDLTATSARLMNDSPAPTVGANVVISSACAVPDASSGLCFKPPGCVDAASCAAGVVTSLAAADFSKDGMRLPLNATCKITQGAAPSLALTFTTDVFGQARTAPPSIGAAEGDLMCN